jgi:hypothetical protein
MSNFSAGSYARSLERSRVRRAVAARRRRIRSRSRSSATIAAVAMTILTGAALAAEPVSPAGDSTGEVPRLEGGGKRSASGDGERRRSRPRRAAVQLPAVLGQIAQCESGGNPGAVSADGTYRGKYQFDVQTWRSLGGTGDPAAAPEAVQDRLALQLYRTRGTAPWANCA